MVVFNSYKSYLSVQFEQFYKKNCIITLYLLIYFSYFIQSLDVGYFNILKRLYGRGFKDFIKIYINYIIKTEFFIAFKTAHFNIITPKNNKANFRDTNLIPYDLQVIISKFDIKLQTLTLIGPFFLDVDLQVF